MPDSTTSQSAPKGHKSTPKSVNPTSLPTNFTFGDFDANYQSKSFEPDFTKSVAVVTTSNFTFGDFTSQQ